MHLRSMVVSAAMGALALVLPVGFHAVGLGSQFLPMLLPLLINGFLSTPLWAVLTALSVPPVSGLLTGMPPLYPPMAAVVALEGATLAGVAALAWRLVRPRLWPALLAAIVCGRLMAVVLTWALARLYHLPGMVAGWAVLLHGLPGVALQLAVTPVVVRYACSRGGPLFREDAR
ncbi:MAG: ECF transporter S component [Bryobacteraceae bacterium]